VEPAAPTMEEPPVTGLTSPGGRVHDKGNPGDEKIWGAAAMSADLARAGVKDAPSSAARDPPAVAEQAPSTAALTAEMGL
jgi:hypothetical protein